MSAQLQDKMKPVEPLDGSGNESGNSGPSGPPELLSGLNPAFYNTVAAAIQSLRQTFSSLVSGFRGGVHKAQPAKGQPIKPKTQAVKQVSDRPSVTNVSGLKKPSVFGPLRKIFKILIIVIMALGLIYWVLTLSDRSGNGNGGSGPGSNIGNGNFTPTPIEIEPSQPSIYALDEVILQLEEDINTLDRELSTTVLRETSLNPPKLDLNVRF